MAAARATSISHHAVVLLESLQLELGALDSVAAGSRVAATPQRADRCLPRRCIMGRTLDKPTQTRRSHPTGRSCSSNTILRLQARRSNSRSGADLNTLHPRSRRLRTHPRRHAQGETIGSYVHPSRLSLA